MISDAPGTVAELHIGIIQIGDSAYFTLSGIGRIVTVAVYLLCRFLIVNDLRIVVSGLSPKILVQPSAAEQQIVQHCDHREQIVRKRRYNDLIQEERCIDIGEPFDLHGNDEEQKNLRFRKQSGKGKEHRKVDIGCGDPNVCSRDEIDHEPVDHGKQDAGEEKQRKLSLSPVLFQRTTDKIVEIKHDQCKNPSAGGNKCKGNQSPDLTFQDHCR